MAESLSHKFGQIIGDLLELALEPHLQKFAKKHKLFLDKKGERKGRTGKKVSWFDGNNNKHDLDFCHERGATNDTVGIPVAFIESAWRRYTKHSRNKAQEIQSAILPLAGKYQNSSPFVGVVPTYFQLHHLKTLLIVHFYSYDFLTIFGYSVPLVA